MSLLRDIQDAAIDANTELSTLLRKCKVLAARLNNAEFNKWVEYELNGYPSVEELPEYRILRVNSKGHFSGPFNSGLRNADIPLFCIPEKYREFIEHSYLVDPIASIENLIKHKDSRNPQEPWSPDLVAIVSKDIYHNMSCMQAWKVIPKQAIIAVAETVRNRVLNFVLEIEAEAPESGEAPLKSSPIPQEKIHQIFNTYITGDVQNIATGSSNFRQKAIQKSSTDNKIFEDIIAAISEVKDDLNTKSSLVLSIEAMRETNGKIEFKEKYQDFMSILADHMQVYGPIVAPFLPMLASLIP
jgi:hypothetical protein